MTIHDVKIHGGSLDVLNDTTTHEVQAAIVDVSQCGARANVAARFEPPSS